MRTSVDVVPFGRRTYWVEDGPLKVRWHEGSHTANVFLYGRETDCFTFGWAQDRAPVAVFLDACAAYLADVDLVEMGA